MSKYHNIRVKADGFTFDSKAEYARYCELKLMEKAEEIEMLEVHPIFPLYIGTVLVTKYEADFKYFRNAMLIIEDVKGVKTDVYRLKKKLMKAIHDCDITEVPVGRKAKRWRARTSA